MPIITKPIDEGKELHGKTYTDYGEILRKGNDPSYAKSKDDNFRTMGVTSLGNGGFLDSVAQSKVEKIDLEKEKIIAESSNLLQEYIMYVSGKMNDALSNYTRTYGNNNTALEDRMVENLMAMKELGIPEDKCEKIVNSEYVGLDIINSLCEKYKVKYDPISNPDDPNIDENIKRKINDATKKAIQNILKLRINYVNKITTLMSEMIKVNYKTLGLSEQQMQEYLKALNSGTNDSVKAAGDIKEKIKENADKFLINDGETVDLRSLGFGVIFGPNSAQKMHFDKTDGSNKDAMLQLIQRAMRYDAVVVAHGGDGNTYTQSNSDKYDKSDDESYKDNWDKDNQKSEFNETLQVLLNKFNKKNDIENHICDVFEKKIFRAFGNYCMNYIYTLDLEYLDAGNPEDRAELSENVKPIKNKIMEASKKCFDIDYDEFIDRASLSAAECDPYKTKIETVLRTSSNLYAQQAIATIDYKLKKMLIDPSTMKTYGSAYSKFDRDKGREQGWFCQPTRTLTSKYFADVNSLLRQLIKEGFKKICVEDCNPGGHSIAKDILATPGVIVTYSKFSNYVESVDLSNDPNIQYINEVEQDLRNLCEEYGFDYDDDDYINECYSWYMSNQDIINEEGLGSKLWEFFKKCVAAIIGFIKRIFNFVKLALTKVKELFFGGESNSEKAKQAKTTIEKPIKTPMLSAKDKKVIEIETSSNAELEKKGNEVISEMMAIIKNLKDKADKGNKEDEKLIKSLEETVEVIKKADKLDSQKESFSMIRSLLEFDAGDGTNQDDDTQVDIEDPDDTSTSTQEEPANDPTPTQDDDPAGATDIDMDDPDSGTSEQTPEPSNEPAPAAEPTTDDPAGATDIDMDDPDATPDAGSDAGEGEYTLGGDDDPAGATDIDMDDPDSEGGEGDPEGGEEPGEGSDDPAGATDIDIDDSEGGEGDDTDGASDSTNNIDDGGDNSEDQISGLKAIENELFENLSDKQKQIKIKELKNNYVDLFNRCDGILDVINTRKPSDETTVQIFEYINNVILDLQNTVHDYLDHTFATKSYLENDAQFKSYLNILNTVNNILKELNIEK